MFKSKSKVFIAVVAGMLASVMTLSACSSSSSSGSESESSAAESSDTKSSDLEKSNDTTEADLDAEPNTKAAVHDFKGSSSDVVDIGIPYEPVDAEKIQKNMHYIPEMFCSSYQIIGSEDKVKDTVTKTGFYKYNEKASSGGGVERQITNLPYKLEGNQYEYIGDAKNPSLIYIMEMGFYDKDGNKQTKKFKYSVTDGIQNVTKAKLKLEEIIDIKYDDTYKKIASYTTAQLKLSYNITIKGFTLTIGNDSDTVEMKTCYNDPTDDKMASVTSFAFISENSPMIDHIAGFSMSEDNYCMITFINDKNEDETSNYSHAQMTDDGVLTFSVPYATKTETYQYVFVYLQHKGLILTDGKTTYRYTSKEEDYKTYKMKSILGDDASTDNISSDKKKDLVVKQNTILTELEEAFASKNIKANIDKSTGRVSLDSNILFASDSSDLSADGKKALDDFLDVYTSVLLSDKNKSYVAKLMVEGHTDTNGDHAYNQTLSEKRAKTVADYCVNKVPALKSITQSKGYSYDYPIYKDDGSVDMDASRRVVFRFMLQEN